MNFELSQEIKDVAAGVLEFIDHVVVPLEDKNRSLLEDERNRYTPEGRYVPEVLALRREVRMKSAEAGYYTMFGSAKMGGDQLGPLAAAHVAESIYKRYGPGRTLIKDVVIPSSFTNGLSRLLEYVDPEVIGPLLPGIASGDKTLCFGLSEPNAGSDVYGIQTRARKEGDEWVISGAKQWVTNSMYADYAVIFAITDPEAAARRENGISAFFVETSREGWGPVTPIPIMGHLGAEIGTIQLDDVRVPENHLMGELHNGFKIAIGGVSTGRLTLSASCVGYAQWGHKRALEYAQQRKTFGKRLVDHQAIEMLLAENAMDIYAAKAMLVHAAWKVDSGQRATKELSMLKAFSTEMFFRVMDRSIQVHGAMGLTNELRLEEGLRLARTMRIPDGTGEIQRRTVVRQMLAGDTDILAL